MSGVHGLRGVRTLLNTVAFLLSLSSHCSLPPPTPASSRGLSFSSIFRYYHLPFFSLLLKLSSFPMVPPFHFWMLLMSAVSLSLLQPPPPSLCLLSPYPSWIPGEWEGDCAYLGRWAEHQTPGSRSLESGEGPYTLSQFPVSPREEQVVPRSWRGSGERLGM